MQKTSFRLELAMWSAFLRLWFQSASFPECTEQVCLWLTEPVKHFETVSSAHFVLQEERILNVAGLSGGTASSSQLPLFFSLVCFFGGVLFFGFCFFFFFFFFKEISSLADVYSLTASYCPAALFSSRPPLSFCLWRAMFSKEQLALMPLG